MEKSRKKILIIGAGFAGVRCALDLSHADFHRKNVQITLVNPYPHFEYHAMLYRVLTGTSPLEECIPLRDIFGNKRRVTVENDTIEDIDFSKKVAAGRTGAKYPYDYCLLALGSETDHMGIEGLADYSFSLKSVRDALRLKAHLHELFSPHIIVVGGGLSGVEIAASLVSYMNVLRRNHSIEKPVFSVDLVSSSPVLVPALSEEISEAVESRLKQLGVNIYSGRRVMKEEVDEVYMKDMRIKTKTVIWAAGVKGNSLYRTWGLPVDSKGRVLVDDYLAPVKTNYQERSNVFVAGDGAAVEGSGTAYAALDQGSCVAENIIRDISGNSMRKYFPEVHPVAVPLGEKWAAVHFGGINIYGRVGWWIKRLMDFRFYVSILPFSKAVAAFREGGVLWESCPVCRGERLD